MILFDSQQWTEEEAQARVLTMIANTTNPEGYSDEVLNTGIERLIRLLKAIREAREKG